MDAYIIIYISKLDYLFLFTDHKTLQKKITSIINWNWRTKLLRIISHHCQARLETEKVICSFLEQERCSCVGSIKRMPVRIADFNSL